MPFRSGCLILDIQWKILNLGIAVSNIPNSDSKYVGK